MLYKFLVLVLALGARTALSLSLSLTLFCTVLRTKSCINYTTFFLAGKQSLKRRGDMYRI